MRLSRFIYVAFIMLLMGTVLNLADECVGEVPTQMSYQGLLLDSDGHPLSGEYNMTFAIYADSADIEPLWTETHNDVSTSPVEVNDGLFEVILGEFVPITAGIFDGTVRWLETTVSGQALRPMKPITSTAYAFLSGEDRIEGSGSTGYLAKFTDPTTIADSQVYDNGTNIGIGMTGPGEKLDVNGNVNADAYYGNGGTLTGIASALETYDSGWFGVSSWSSYVFVHNLGTTKAIFLLYGATDGSGSNMTMAWGAWEGNDGQKKHALLGKITNTTCEVITGIHAPCACWNGSDWQAATYMRVIAVALE